MQMRKAKREGERNRGTSELALEQDFGAVKEARRR